MAALGSVYRVRSGRCEERGSGDGDGDGGSGTTRSIGKPVSSMVNFASGE